MTKHHPTSRRVHRQHHDEDAFVAAALEGSVWAKTHSRIMLGIGVALIVAVAAFLYIRNFQAAKVQNASVELTTVRQTVLQGNRQLAERDLQTFVRKFGSTPAGEEARLMLAQVYLEEKKPAQAIEAVRELAGNPAKAGGASAALMLGAAYEANKQTDKAEQTYLNVADKARFGFEKREALERAASLRLAKNNTAGAAELYDRAMKTLPEDSPERVVYQMRMAEVQAAGATTAAAASTTGS
jgi:predicted negative regulator of RcsB-dependent stress response